MPRQTRYYISGVTQHVIQRGNNRQPTFFAEADYRFYLECLKQAMYTYACEISAYVLMPNHVHLLVTPHRRDGVPKLMQAVGRGYVHYVNRTYQRSGTLWEGRYKASLVDSSYLLSCYQYIEWNPLRAKLANHPADYLWSSYRYHGLGEHSDVLVNDPMYLALGEAPEVRRAKYRQLLKQGADEHVIEDIRESIHHCGVLGTDEFKDEIEATLSRRVRPRKRGRPKKEKHASLENRV